MEEEREPVGRYGGGRKKKEEELEKESTPRF